MKKISKLVLLSVFLLFIGYCAKAQPVAINANGADAHASAILDVSSGSKGVLLPRIANSGVISAPAEGLLIYNTTSQCFQYYANTGWQTLGLCAQGAPVSPEANSNTGGVAFNETGDAPHGSAALDISSDNKGVLVPRMTTVERDLIDAPAPSLLIYNTDTHRLEFRENNLWHAL